MAEKIHSAPSVGDDIIFQRVSDGAVLLSTDGEIYYGLNEVGAAIWERLDADKSVEAICGELEERYPEVDPQRIRSDVASLLDELVREGLVSLPKDSEGDGRGRG